MSWMSTPAMRSRDAKVTVQPASRLNASMPEPYADPLATVAAGRTALVTRLRTITKRIEQLPLDAAAAVLVLLEPASSGRSRRANARGRAAGRRRRRAASR